MALYIALVIKSSFFDNNLGERYPYAGAKKSLFEVGQGDGTPEIVGEVADQEFIDQVDGPEDIVDDQQDDRMVVVPADHEGVETQDAIDYAGIAVVHAANITKKGPLPAPLHILLFLYKWMASP
jgi:hypothetical protein